MIGKIPEEIKKKVINDYINTKIYIKSIAKKNGLLYEQVIAILQEYQALQSNRLTRNIIIITDEEIYEQREKGLSYNAISEFFKNQGKQISHTMVMKRCKDIYEKKDKKEPKAKYKIKIKNTVEITDEEIENKKTAVDEEGVREQILKLKETKGATDEQMEKMANLYGISLYENKLKLHDDKNNSNGER